MSKPIISIIAPSIRPELWMEFYAHLLEDNSIPFEIVFVGNVKPKFILPVNFHFIYSETTPVQCFETACRNSKGEYILTTADDLYNPPGILNALYGYAIRMHNDKAVIIARFADKIDSGPMDNLLCFQPDLDCPVIGAPVLIKKSVWEELGGLDKQFNFIFSTDDLQLRIYEAGGHPFILPQERFTIKEKPHLYPRLMDNFTADRITLNSFWIKSTGEFSKKRLKDAIFFTEKDIVINL